MDEWGFDFLRVPEDSRAIDIEGRNPRDPRGFEAFSNVETGFAETDKADGEFVVHGYPRFL